VKNVLIIGASGDIGIAIAESLAEEGYQLILHYHTNRDGIEALREKVAPESILAVIQADLCKENDIRMFLTQLVFPVDMIVFVSGRAHFGLFQDTSEEIMDDMLTLHVKAPWLITKHLLPHMVQSQFGKIIFITSIWGDVGASNEVIYSSVKGAQNSFVKALAKEVAPSGISVNAISPGYVDTKMNSHLDEDEKNAILSDIPMNRAGSPADVANAVSFLLDDRSNYIQGEIIHLTGGW
jgi:3-oxoacyl-[acyl-carrier protein] reductase